MSASASKRMPDLGYKAVNRYTGPPSCLPARMDKRYYDGHSGGNRLINPPVCSLATYVNEGRTEYGHGAVIIP